MKRLFVLRISFLIILLSLSLGLTFANNSLTVNDPHGWVWTQGNIDKATLKVTPAGAYIQNDLFLTMSMKGSGFENSYSSTQMEIELDFDLPTGSFVNDSWLLFEGDWLKAEIRDVWSATQIYEDIVDRRRDPSILTKTGANSYKIRIYPMMGNSSRQVKISYLTPAQSHIGELTGEIPIDLLNTSRTNPDLEVILHHTFGYDYAISGHQPSTSDLNNKVFTYKLTSDDWSNNPAITFTKNEQQSIYFKKFEGNQSNYYSFTFDPATIIDGTNSHQIAVVLDLTSNPTAAQNNDIIDLAKNNLLKQVTPNDSFNIFYNKFSVQRYSETWVPATTENIVAAFNEAKSKLRAQSNLTTLLEDVSEFCNDHMGNQSIYLLSNSSEIHTQADASAYIKYLKSAFTKLPQFLISDFFGSTSPSSYFNNQYYYGNAFFYQELAYSSKGNVLSYRSFENYGYTYESAENIASKPLEHIGLFLTEFSIHAAPTNGITYGKHNISGDNSRLSLNKPYTQVGKYIGKFPFKIEFSGIHNDKLYFKTFTIEEPGNSNKSDSLLKGIWTGNQIEAMYDLDNSNETITGIIDYSIDARILANYTAFLALETSNTTTDEEVNVEITGNEDELELEMEISAYPNPFADRITVNLASRDIRLDQGFTVSIYDLEGRLVYEIEDPELFGGEMEFEWDGTNASGEKVPTGTYLIVVTAGNQKITKKVIMN